MWNKPVLATVVESKFGGISSFKTIVTKIFTENIFGQLYCDVLQTESKNSVARFPKKSKIIFQEDLSSWHTSHIVKEKRSPN